MTQQITVNVPHSLGREEARRRIEENFANLQQQIAGGMGGAIAFTHRWESDRLEFEASTLGQKMTGRFEVLPESVHIELDLPAMLAMLASKITGKLQTETRKLLENK